MQKNQTPFPMAARPVLLKVQNNSMAPKLKPNATVQAVPLPLEELRTQRNRVYAIAFKNSLVIARIKKNRLKEKRRLTLHFDNPDFRPITISGREIVGVWEVSSIISQEVK